MLSSSGLWCMIFLGLLVLLGTIQTQRILSTTYKSGTNDYNQSDELIDWSELNKLYTDYVNQRSEPIRKRWKVIRATLEQEQKLSVGSECLDVIESIVDNPIQQQWTAKLIDSNRFLSTGILSGTITELGEFDQCLSIKGQFEGKDLVGKYCLATVNIPRTRLFESVNLNRSALEPAWIGDLIKNWYDNDNYYALANAVCFPSICNQNEIRSILLQYYSFLDQFEFDVQYCQSNNESSQYDPRIWIALALFGLPWLLIGPATLLDILQQSKDTNQASSSKLVQLLLCFSFPSNLKQLFQIKGDNYNNDINDNQVETTMEKNRFQFVHGIRTIASIFIIVTNSVTLVNVLSQSPISLLEHHPTDMLAITRQWSSQPFSNGWLIALIFSMLSGMFTIYRGAQPDRLKYNFFQYVLLRWLRFTPALIGTICLSIILEFIGNGPLFQHDLLWPSLRPCYEEWWQNLLFINNFGNPHEKCQMQTWYLAANMQLSVLAFVLLWIYTKAKHRHLVSLISAAFIVLGMAMIVAVVGFGLAKLRLYQTLMVDPRNPPDIAVFSQIYFSPQMQAIGFFMGAIIGQIILDHKDYNISMTTKKFWWAVSWLARVTIPFFSFLLVRDVREKLNLGYSSIGHAMLFSVGSLVWCLSNGWLIYQCAVDRHNPVGRLLSAKWFQPLSRMSYSIYLIQPITVWYNLYQTRHPVSMSTFFDVVRIFCFSLIVSIVLSVILYTSFEGPVSRLVKLLFKKEKNKKLSNVQHSKS